MKTWFNRFDKDAMNKIFKDQYEEKLAKWKVVAEKLEQNNLKNSSVDNLTNDINYEKTPKKDISEDSIETVIKYLAEQTNKDYIMIKKCDLNNINTLKRYLLEILSNLNITEDFHE